MPLEPADPGRRTRRIDEAPGTARLIPAALVLITIFGIVGLLGFCAMSRDIATRSERIGGAPVGESFDVVEARLNTRDALLDAGRAQEQYFEANGSYTKDFAVLTDAGMWSGVDLRPVVASADGYCIEASYESSDRVWHLTEALKRPQRGGCSP